MTKKKRKPTQSLIPGVVTEGDIIRAYMSKLGKKGGSVRGGKKGAASRRNIMAYNERMRQEIEAKNGTE